MLWAALGVLLTAPFAKGQFAYWETNGAVEITQYYGSSSDVVIPSTIDGLPVTSLGNYSFYQSTITSVSIPSTVTNIGSYVFYGCASLANVSMDNSATGIGYAAFAYCHSLTNLFTGDNIRKIGDYAFLESGLKTLFLPNALTNIGYAAFDGSTNLTSATLGSGIQYLDAFAFGDCFNLKAVYFAGNAPTADSTAFNNDTLTVFYISGTSGWAASFNSLPTAIWLPQMTSARVELQGAQFAFNVTWGMGRTAIVQTCTNLSNAAWTGLETNVLGNGPWHFSDTDWKNYRGRFYRVRAQ